MNFGRVMVCRNCFLAWGFAVGTKYYAEFSVMVVGSTKFVTVCCNASGMQPAEVLKGNKDFAQLLF
jgi:hypothetical protein